MALVGRMLIGKLRFQAFSRRGGSGNNTRISKEPERVAAPFIGACLTNFRYRKTKLLAKSVALAEQNMAAASNRRKSERVIFERGIDAFIMGIDGTWRRDCFMEDVSQTGTKLTIHGSIEGLHLKEFFLLLSSTGLAYRRCELAWVNGDQIGAKFVTQPQKKKLNKAGMDDRSTV
jgi:hypothetical protein